MKISLAFAGVSLSFILPAFSGFLVNTILPGPWLSSFCLHRGSLLSAPCLSQQPPSSVLAYPSSLCCLQFVLPQLSMLRGSGKGNICPSILTHPLLSAPGRRDIYFFSFLKLIKFQNTQNRCMKSNDLYITLL